MKGIVIGTDDEVEVFTFTNEDGWDGFRKTLGGLVEVVPQNFNSRVSMYCNEEGKIMGLEVNRFATLLSGLYPQDFVVGKCIVVGALDGEGEDTGLPDDLIEAVKAIDVEASIEKMIDREYPFITVR